MNVLVDTNIWSLRLRRATADDPRALDLTRLITEDRAQLIGPVRQEVLTGIKHREQFDRVREALRSFPDWPVTPQHFERAAEISNSCKTAGIQGSPTDFLLCAVATIDNLELYTLDQDFDLFAAYVSIKRYVPKP